MQARVIVQRLRVACQRAQLGLGLLVINQANLTYKYSHTSVFRAIVGINCVMYKCKAVISESRFTVTVQM